MRKRGKSEGGRGKRIRECREVGGKGKRKGRGRGEEGR